MWSGGENRTRMASLEGRGRRACTVHLVIWLRLWLTPETVTRRT